MQQGLEATSTRGQAHQEVNELVHQVKGEILKLHATVAAQNMTGSQALLLAARGMHRALSKEEKSAAEAAECK